MNHWAWREDAEIYEEKAENFTRSQNIKMGIKEISKNWNESKGNSTIYCCSHRTGRRDCLNFGRSYLLEFFQIKTQSHCS